MICLRAQAFFRALLEVVERREDHGGIRRIGEGGAVKAHNGHGMGDAGRLQHELGHRRVSSSVRAMEAPGGSWMMLMR